MIPLESADVAYRRHFLPCEPVQAALAAGGAVSTLLPARPERRDNRCSTDRRRYIFLPLYHNIRIFVRTVHWVQWTAGTYGCCEGFSFLEFVRLLRNISCCRDMLSVRLYWFVIFIKDNLVHTNNTRNTDNALNLEFSLMWLYSIITIMFKMLSSLLIV